MINHWIKYIRLRVATNTSKQSKWPASVNLTFISADQVPVNESPPVPVDLYRTCTGVNTVAKKCLEALGIASFHLQIMVEGASKFEAALLPQGLDRLQ